MTPGFDDLIAGLFLCAMAVLVVAAGAGIMGALIDLFGRLRAPRDILGPRKKGGR